MSEHTPPIDESPRPEHTRLYRDALQKPVADLRAELAPRFEGNEFILVRGFLTDVLDRAGVMMADQLQAVRDLHRPARKAANPFDSENAPDANAAVIAGMVRAATLPVIFV